MNRIAIAVLGLCLSLLPPTVSWEASVSKNLAIQVTSGGPPPTAEVPGPSQTLFASPPYTCTTNKYVSPTGGGDGSSTGTT